jgi:hypothetical protein
MALNSSRKITDDLSLTDALEFFMLKKMLGLHTLTLAEVLEVNSDKSRMTVQSLINNVDNNDRSAPAPQIYDVPCVMMRGGNAGLITEYKKDDKVLIGYCERQIDAVKRTEARQTPALFRSHALEDAIIIGHWSNTLPSIYVKITDDEVTIEAVDKPITIVTTGNTIVKANNATIEATTLATIKAPNIKLDGIVEATSSMTISNNLSVSGKDFITHVHSGVTSGGSNTGALV